MQTKKWNLTVFLSVRLDARNEKSATADIKSLYSWRGNEIPGQFSGPRPETLVFIAA